MSHLTGKERAQYVRSMFGRIAPRYDLMNRIMTLGQDARWRREAVSRLRQRPGEITLDLGTGTGDLALEAVGQGPGCTVIAADFTPEMIHWGRQRPGGITPRWLLADGLELPFADEAFDNVISGFFLRNVADLPRALREQARVLRRGGRWVCLETTPPAPGPFRPLVRLHLQIVIPMLGWLLAGSPEAYRYLPRSVQAFQDPSELSAAAAASGFENVQFSRRMLGTIAIHWGRRR